MRGWGTPEAAIDERGGTALAEEERASASPPASPWRGAIDAGIHNTVPRIQALFPYLSDHWREYIGQSAFKGPVDTAYPPGAPTSARPGSAPDDGSLPGSGLGLLRRHVLDPLDVEAGILTCAYAVDSIHNPDTASAIARAVNEWQIAEWLEPEPRLRASLVVPVQQPEMAAQEIDRLGDHPRVVQVSLPVCSAMPYGNRHYHPIFEAAARHDLVIGLHFGGAPGNPPTASGWPSYYIEDYANMAQVFQTQIMSLIVEGVFDRFPTLRVACVEGGFTWVPSLMWRMDKEWKGLRRDVPWVRRRPSEYVREHMRFTIQPLDAPPEPEQMAEIVDQMDSEDLLLFATGHPHWHFDDMAETMLPPGLTERLQHKILAENARAFYGL